MNALFNRNIASSNHTISSRGVSVIIKLLLMAWLLLSTLSQPLYAANAHWLTLVSLTFDDGNYQSAARNILLNHGMHGTFYVNSDKIGSTSSYLTKADLDTLYADGNEIAGHTIGHVDLATLTDAQQKTAICNDMQTLIGWGYPVHSFAYPFSSTGPTTQSIVANGCGINTYESARAVGGLVSGTECVSCPYAETIPPANKHYIATNNSIINTTSLVDIKNYVIQAENNGGGWVPIVIHRVCDNCGSSLSVSPAILDAFLTWLQTRESIGTYVKTVHQVMTGDYPVGPPQPPLGLNILKNPSLELDADANNQPDCWQRYGYGTNTATWTHSSGDAHSGIFSEKLAISAYSSGDRKLMPTLDAGACAPSNIFPGDIYQLSAWYKSTVPSTVVLFYRDINGMWQYWRDGPQIPASANWRQMIHYPGPVPQAAQGISFGISLNSVGTLSTDDYSMAMVLNNPLPTDTISPQVSIVAPINGATVTGTVSITATATDNVAVSKVNFLVNGAVIGSSTTAPYTFNWNSTLSANGTAVLTAQAFDAAGNSQVASAVNVTINNQTPVSNLLNNPSLEIDANSDGVPDCWQFAGFGVNTPIWTRLSGTGVAHSGNVAESLQITARTSGDRKLVQIQNTGTCAPTVTPGLRYTLSGWYKSTVPTGIVVYYRTSTGVWQYWQTSANFAATNTWTQASYLTPVIPASATAISFGLFLSGVGTLVTDDYSMTLAP